MQRSKVLPDSLEQRADDEDVVKGRKANEDPVEDGGHPLAQEDGDYDEVAGKTDGDDDDLKHLPCWINDKMRQDLTNITHDDLGIVAVSRFAVAVIQCDQIICSIFDHLHQ